MGDTNPFRSVGYDTESHSAKMDLDLDQGSDNSASLKRSRSSSVSSDDSDTTVKDLKMAKVDEDCVLEVSGGSVQLTKLDPVKVKKWLDQLTGKCKISTNSRGNLIVHCSMAGGTCLMKATHFENHKIQVERYIPKVFEKGIIHGVDERFSVDELKMGLSADGVDIIDVKRLGKSKSVVITFRGKKLPSHVYYGYLRFTVKVYIPMPVRCFKCQRFGHIAAKCRSNLRCGNCGENHDTKECVPESSTKCCNCGENHKASSKECPFFVEAKEIVSVKTTLKISYADAIKKVKGPKSSKLNQKSPAPNITAKASTSLSSSSASTRVPEERSGQSPPFSWSEFAAFMVKISYTFSSNTFKDKSDIERITLCADLIQDFFHVQVDKNKTCHTFFSDKTSQMSKTNTK